MLLNAAAGSILRTVHVMQSRDIVRSVFSAMVCFCEMRITGIVTIIISNNVIQNVRVMYVR